MNSQGLDATDEELIAIVRRIDTSGNGTMEFKEFSAVVEPIILKNANLQQVED